MGWWVGPSSPRPMESWVITYITEASDKAEILTVVSKQKESCAVWDKTGAVKGNAVADSSHTVDPIPCSLTPNLRFLSSVVAFWKFAECFKQCHVERCKVSKCVKTLLRQVSGGITRRFWCICLNEKIKLPQIRPFSRILIKSSKIIRTF